jgi:hypothetical protein
MGVAIIYLVIFYHPFQHIHCPVNRGNVAGPIEIRRVDSSRVTNEIQYRQNVFNNTVNAVD